MTPGPTPAPPQVLAALSAPVIHHRARDYRELFETLLHRLGEVFQTRHDVLVYTCSGTGGMESAIANVCRPGERVLVVSACHSGSFIPALADAKTLVIAAARADRSSFGCNDKREWTYFGEAYFNQALRKETSFKKAFKQASELIKTWEAKEKLLPSLPQMKGGEALELAE